MVAFFGIFAIPLVDLSFNTSISKLNPFLHLFSEALQIPHYLTLNRLIFTSIWLRPVYDLLFPFHQLLRLQRTPLPLLSLGCFY